MERVDANVEGLRDKIKFLTPVLHVNRIAVTTLDKGRLLAKRIPCAQFLEPDSRNHIHLDMMARHLLVVALGVGLAHTRAPRKAVPPVTSENAVDACIGYLDAMVAR